MHALTIFSPIDIDENEAVKKAINNSLKTIAEDVEKEVPEELPVLFSVEFKEKVKDYAVTKIYGDFRSIVLLY